MQGFSFMLHDFTLSPLLTANSLDFTMSTQKLAIAVVAGALAIFLGNVAFATYTKAQAN